MPAGKKDTYGTISHQSHTQATPKVVRESFISPVASLITYKVAGAGRGQALGQFLGVAGAR